jgi:hypothetical protein
MKNMPLEFVRRYKILAEIPLLEDFCGVPFIGTLRSAFGYRQSLVYIIPTGERNMAIQAEVHEYVKKVRDESDPETPILTDEQALKQDLSYKTPVVYGTQNGNLFLAEHLANHPIVVEADSLTADKVYQGLHLRFITAWPHPQNKTKGMVIYTAQEAEDIIGICDVPAWDEDYVVGRTGEVLKRGVYKKDGGRWSFGDGLQ